MTVETIKFDSDTAERKKLFTAASFSHPAKMHLSLQVYLVERYTKAGDTILDPMGGSGTLLAACALGRNVVLVELEQKFCKMMEKNWLKIKSLGPMLGYTMGEAAIFQGDARNLDGLLADSCIFSPPYADQPEANRTNHGILNHPEKCKCNFCRKNRGNKGINQGYRKADNILFSPPYAAIATGGTEQDAQKRKKRLEKAGYDTKKLLTPGRYKHGNLGVVSNYNPDNPANIQNLPYGKIDTVISSPPFGEAHEKNIGGVTDKNRADLKDCSYLKTGTKGQIGDMPYADAVITSPPYEGINTTGKTDSYNGSHGPHSQVQIQDYRESNNNIGNLKSENYLSAMAQVYRQCHSVLKPEGLLVLVVKNFIRDKKIVRLDLDTIKLCEQAGFKLIERLKRKLTQQSFWRTIYYNKFPDVEKIEYEDILVFQRQKGL